MRCESDARKRIGTISLQSALSLTDKQFGRHEHATSLRTADATALVVTRRRIPLAKSIGLELHLQPLRLPHIAANRSSKVFPICDLAVEQAKARKQDARRGVLQSSRSRADHHFAPKNIGARNSPVRALHHRFRRNVVAETANLP